MRREYKIRERRGAWQPGQRKDGKFALLIERRAAEWFEKDIAVRKSREKDDYDAEIGRKRRARWRIIRAAGGAAGRAEDTSGKRAAYFYRQIRRRIYAARAYENRAERENKEPCARQRRKGRKEVLRTDKNGRGESKPRVRGSVRTDENGELRENR